jgi:uncharacterized protein (DUF1330 family)
MAAYMIFRNTLEDFTVYPEYLKAAGGTVEAFGGKLLVLAEDTTILEGDPGYKRCVILEFPDKEKALGWYHSDAYQAAIPLRHKCAPGWAFLTEGVSA